MDYQKTKEGAIAAHKRGRFDEAISLYQACLSADPRDPDLFNNLGAILFKQGNLADAEELIKHSLRINKRLPSAHFNLALVMRAAEQPELAIKSYKNALKWDSKFIPALENLVTLYDELGKPKEKLPILSRLRGLRDHPIDLLAIAKSHSELADHSRYESNLKAYQDSYGPLPSIDYFNSMEHLRRGDLGLARIGYEARWMDFGFLKSQGNFAIPPVRKWTGENLSGKSLLIVPDQGIGDEILYCKCLNALPEQCSKIFVICQNRLINTFRRSFNNHKFEFITRSENLIIEHAEIAALKESDYFAFFSDLPCILYNDKREIASDAWIFPDVNRFKSPSSDSRLKVGISWRGGAAVFARSKRSIPLEKLIGLFSPDSHELFPLQYDMQEEELSQAQRSSFHSLTKLDDLDYRDDLDGVFSLMHQLDYVVTVDNTIAQMAMAIGKPTITIIPEIADWRWFANENVALWNSNTRLIRMSRQSSVGQLFSQIRNEIAKLETQLGSSRQVIDLGPSVNNRAMPPKTPSPEGQNYLILNDTLNWYHFGCTLTSLALHRELLKKAGTLSSVSAHEITKIELFPTNRSDFTSEAMLLQLENRYPEIWKRLHMADVIVVNGEGTLHGNGSAAMTLLYLIWISKNKLKKDVKLINHSLFPEDNPVAQGDILEIYKMVLEDIDCIVVRDRASMENALKMGLQPKLGFDCLPLTIKRYYEHLIHEPSQDYLVLGGNVNQSDLSSQLKTIKEVLSSFDHFGLIVLLGARAYLAADDLNFSTSCHKLFGKRVTIRYASNETDWVKTIASSKGMISGRFHYSIAARCFEKPTFMLPSNTPKNEAIAQTIGGTYCSDHSVLNQTLKKFISSLDKDSLKEPSTKTLDDLVTQSQINFDWL